MFDFKSLRETLGRGPLSRQPLFGANTWATERTGDMGNNLGPTGCQAIRAPSIEIEVSKS